MSKAKALEVIQEALDNSKTKVAGLNNATIQNPDDKDLQQSLFAAKIHQKDCEDALDWVQRKSAFN